ncbi:hypothetical protein E5351_05640 [Lactobacillus intestinalis]|uniref:Uncharacterized protein n=1 Tax=Lactobacillus intestinalis TaxID=151781 RepID=A0A4S2BLT2_9LACO|nr:hypothetical protein E5351_05640 [Lactobacillus intestinalis]
MYKVDRSNYKTWELVNNYRIGILALCPGSIFAAILTQILNIAGSTSVIMLCSVDSDFLELNGRPSKIGRLLYWRFLHGYQNRNGHFHHCSCPHLLVYVAQT